MRALEHDVGAFGWIDLDPLGPHRQQRPVALAHVDRQRLHHIAGFELDGGDIVVADLGDGAFQLVVLADELGDEGILRPFVEFVRASRAAARRHR